MKKFLLLLFIFIFGCLLENVSTVRVTEIPKNIFQGQQNQIISNNEHLNIADGILSNYKYTLKNQNSDPELIQSVSCPPTFPKREITKFLIITHSYIFKEFLQKGILVAENPRAP